MIIIPLPRFSILPANYPKRIAVAGVLSMSGSLAVDKYQKNTAFYLIHPRLRCEPLGYAHSLAWGHRWPGGTAPLYCTDIFRWCCTNRYYINGNVSACWLTASATARKLSLHLLCEDTAQCLLPMWSVLPGGRLRNISHGRYLRPRRWPMGTYCEGVITRRSFHVEKVVLCLFMLLSPMISMALFARQNKMWDMEFLSDLFLQS